MGKSVVDIGQVLVDVLKQALSQERITFGVFECAEVLEMCPEQVMLCVLPKTTNADMTMSIQHKLIEAHCWENGVNLVRKVTRTNNVEQDQGIQKETSDAVDSAEKLVALLSNPNNNNPGHGTKTNTTNAAGARPPLLERNADLSCVLVGFPLDDMSEEDFQITKCSYLFQETDVDAIALPD